MNLTTLKAALGTAAPRLWITGIVVLLDQVTKPLVRAAVPLHESVPVVPGFLSLTHVRNTGMAYGLFDALTFAYKTPLLIAISTCAIGGLSLYAGTLPREQRLAQFGLFLILGGAVGNLIDRVRTGYVLDFVDVYWRTYHFWTFNVADSAITIGAVLLIYELLFNSHVPDPV